MFDVKDIFKTTPFVLDHSNMDRLRGFVLHREKLLDQLQCNFGDIRQTPCYSSTDMVFIGFSIHVSDVFINRNMKHSIILKFDRRDYRMQVKVDTNGKLVTFYTWLYWKCDDYSIFNSRRFIELCYKFLNTYSTIRYTKIGIESRDIRKHWDKLINEVPKSI